MDTYKNGINIPYAPTDAADLYPETDGKPMAASDLHLEILICLLQTLKAHFADRPEVYVSGDILTYYIQGNPRAVVAPDVLVAFGIGQKKRHTYKVWEEGKGPDFVMEFSSKTTYQNDLTDKMALYAALGIPNYLLYDAEALYLPSPLMGFQLVKGTYVPVPPGDDGGIHSDVLGLDFHIRERHLAVYDPVNEQWLQTPAEQHAARAENAETRAAQATIARQKAEEELKRLQEQLAHLQAHTDSQS
ncbi:Uma2 family endonuclease [Candidatus Poribacteria bacterium]|nr:Uma2 family endonuclease [Candidatus Poribacteria bacterium]MYH80802.1 Uma2 family endonuclease [Candidatus Poribacteria bacterium]MYK94330.1 Uma2 family endonuclease [Candidatus Poribacteria bacterium]